MESETVVAAIARPHIMDMLKLSQKNQAIENAVINGPNAPKTAMPHARLIDLKKFDVLSSKPSANMIMMMPISAKLSMKWSGSFGKMPVLTIKDPRARKYRTGVRRVLAAKRMDT